MFEIRAPYHISFGVFSFCFSNDGVLGFAHLHHILTWIQPYVYMYIIHTYIRKLQYITSVIVSTNVLSNEICYDNLWDDIYLINLHSS